ncbi:uncharacterized protein ARMOST_08239 [Armillaria ostoyae]|uniref:Uncharacterized protein n=1 Tax=Armillaria ostoyae TaxID=47428 RepID=A0A284R821_ARMOS|nr:uncharacterized protein ARMOST_08239 [Armillaria ostoyae]
MAITITLPEEHVERLVQSVSNLVTQVEMQGDASHYRALVLALMAGEQMVRDSDELDYKGAIANNEYPPHLSSLDPLLSPINAMDNDCSEDATLFGTSSTPVKVCMLSDDLPLNAETHLFNDMPSSSPLKSTSHVVNCTAIPFIPTLSSAHCLSPALQKTVSITQTSTSPIPVLSQICLLDDCGDAPPAKRTCLTETHELICPDADYDPDGSDADFNGDVIHAHLPGECEKRKGDKK